ncbi:MAG: hypothetical protein N2C14_16800 [Planctomycetales bacterium]
MTDLTGGAVLLAQASDSFLPQWIRLTFPGLALIAFLLLVGLFVGQMFGAKIDDAPDEQADDKPNEPTDDQPK